MDARADAITVCEESPGSENLDHPPTPPFDEASAFDLDEKYRAADDAAAQTLTMK